VRKLSITTLANIPIIRQGDNLAEIILKALQNQNLTLQDGDILVVTQKIVSKSEGRMVDLQTVRPTKRAIQLANQSGKDPRLVELILQESKSVLRVRPGIIVVEHRLGFICANAGIDHSNVQDGSEDPHVWMSLLPIDPDGSAAKLRSLLESQSKTRLGVMIIDSHGRAWRIGTSGVAIGLSGLPALVDLRGKPDLFGDPLRITVVGAADELAAAASLLMGQADEGTPVVHVRGFPYPLREGGIQELIRPEDQDLFR
jgi:coenzyme F420-0:L-glutamate ligase/coenzyme F420-1:gamma-L-glutamate ligase